MRSSKAIQDRQFRLRVSGSMTLVMGVALAVCAFALEARAGGACCHACTGHCQNYPTGGACALPYVMHEGATCGSTRACMLNGGDGPCLNLTVVCCGDMGGVSLGKYSVCEDMTGGACCVPPPPGSDDGSCEFLDEYQCYLEDGSFLGVGTYCNCSTRACCGEFEDACTNQDSACCDGTLGGAGSTCATAECGACCSGEGEIDCNAQPEATCTTGFAGAGTVCGGGEICEDARVCCNSVKAPSSHCQNLPISECVLDEGTPYFDEEIELCSQLDSTDGDTVKDLCDNCPNHNNQNQIDGDGDHFGDVCDYCPSTASAANLDTDGDGTAGVGLGDACDNCPTVPNSGQEDCDSDAIGDVCPTETDIDGDGVPNVDDICDYTPTGLYVPSEILDNGTVVGDLDGDCDVDNADLSILNSFRRGSGSCTGNDNTNHTDSCP